MIFVIHENFSVNFALFLIVGILDLTRRNILYRITGINHSYFNKSEPSGWIIFAGVNIEVN